MKRLITAALSVFAGAALAQQTVTTTTVVKNVTTTIVEQVTCEQQSSELKKIAVLWTTKWTAFVIVSRPRLPR